MLLKRQHAKKQGRKKTSYINRSKSCLANVPRDLSQPNYQLILLGTDLGWQFTLMTQPLAVMRLNTPARSEQPVSPQQASPAFILNYTGHMLPLGVVSSTWERVILTA